MYGGLRTFALLDRLFLKSGPVAGQLRLRSSSRYPDTVLGIQAAADVARPVHVRALAAT
jgi:hypothetical protein